MGLDVVELFMSVEEHFAVEIPDEAAERIGSPADLVAYLATRLPMHAESGCHSQQLFYRLRRGFRRQVPALLGRFAPDTKLVSIVHRDQWPRVWDAIRADVGTPTWPTEIRWPQRLFQGDGPTIGELIGCIAAELPAPPEGEPWTRATLEAEVRRLITEVTAVEDYDMRGRWYEDLGLS